MPNRAATWITAVMLTVGIVISACGGDDSSSSSPASEATTMTASPDEQLCEDREALEDSIEALAGVDVVAEGTSGVEEAVTDVQASVRALSSSAAEDFQPEVDATRTALEELETALGDTGSAGVTGVVSAIEDVVSSGDALLQSLQDVDCG
jgi:ABC-type glycerol-3-phosphate transport system substrate-binding protein